MKYATVIFLGPLTVRSPHRSRAEVPVHPSAKITVATPPHHPPHPSYPSPLSYSGPINPKEEQRDAWCVNRKSSGKVTIAFLND